MVGNVCGKCPGELRKIVWVKVMSGGNECLDPMHYYKSLRGAVMICVTLVNRRADTQTETNSF